MKIAGSNIVPFPVDQVWDAILDPRVLVATIPGCERLETTGEHHYSMTVTAGVAAIKGTYAGSCALSDLAEHQSLVMRLQGAGAPGTIDATVDVSFNDLGTEGTRIDYEADAVVGGMVGGVGQRMLSSVSKRMAGEFFGNVGNAIAAPAESAPVSPGSTAESAPVSPGQVFSAPPKSAAISSQDDFVKGIVVGAGLVLLGVIAGSVFGRRR
ncbi:MULTISPECIES: SRPBCC family protein [unclassified Nocardioides]|uniref:SRPBCC family protein n=1 Tax=unclassified Nocardioides TaxID=2615069 RepID=UPI0009EFDF2F|nr:MULTISPECIES: carbon monoxide dehydrogenase subunit G [unclassified Nocardioides]GAW52317.1 carbon monoxide dehydrogenase subunit G [Nocardioides sp. PD653-B2]GAW57049.1 carbon monoxide dehydrogenase subunit G [Nocardioides sp. PD653]